MDKLDVIKFNLEVFKIKNLIDEINLNPVIKEELNDYLFKLDENNDFKLNDILIQYNFSKYDILYILNDYLIDLNEDVTLNHIKESFNEKLHQSYLEITFPELNKSKNENLNNLRMPDYVINNETIDEIISQIPVENFNCQSSSDNLIRELNEFIKIPIFKFISNGLEDVEVSKLINKIETDILSKKIFGDLSDIIDFYFENYKVLKRKVSLNYYLNQLIQSQSFVMLRGLSINP